VIACSRCDFGSEQEPPPLDGANERLPSSGVTDGAASRIDTAVQSGIGYDAACPNLLDQLVFADDPIGILGKVEKQIEDLRLHVNYTVRASELPPVCINQEFIELEHQVSSSSSLF
jgi:hypothetical protein